jgi:hypothetical protein
MFCTIVPYLSNHSKIIFIKSFKNHIHQIIQRSYSSNRSIIILIKPSIIIFIVNISTYQYINMSTCQYHYVNVSIHQYITVNISQCQYIITSIYHCQYINTSLCRYIIVPIHHYVDTSLC